MQSNLETASILTAALTLNNHSTEAMLAYMAMMEFEQYRLGYKETIPEASHCVDTRKCLIDSYVEAMLAIPRLPEDIGVKLYLTEELKTDISITIVAKIAQASAKFDN